VIDTGFVSNLKLGRIAIRPAVDRFEGNSVVYADETGETVDVVISATGFRTGLDRILPSSVPIDDRGRLRSFDDRGAGPHTNLPGLHFVGFRETVRGQLYEINQQSRRVASNIAQHLKADYGAAGASEGKAFTSSRLTARTGRKKKVDQHLEVFIVRVTPLKPAGNLLRRPRRAQLPGHHTCQSSIACQFTSLRSACPIPGGSLCTMGAVTGESAITSEFAGNR
jgi:hypothetical protein